MFEAGVGSARSRTIFVDAAESDIGIQTSPESDVLDSLVSRRPNSLRVGKVSATMLSPLNHEEYITDHPRATAKFCCAERASVVASLTGSMAETSTTFGFSTVRKSLQPTLARTAAAPSVRRMARWYLVMLASR